MIRRSLFAAAVALCGSTAVLADRPLLTNDPRTLDPGDWQLNTALVVKNFTGGVEAVQVPHVEANYGLQDNLQLRVAGAVAAVDTPTSDGARLDDLLVGVKYRFLENGPAGFDLSVFPQLSYTHHYDQDDLGGRHSNSYDLSLPLQAGKDINGYYVFGEAGLVFRGRGVNDRLFVAAGVEREINADLTLLADAQLDLANGVMLTVEVGARYELNHDVSLIGALATSLGNNDVDEYDARLYLGAQWNLD